MAWVTAAAVIYVLAGLGCYFYGFDLIQKLRKSRFGKWGNPSAAAQLQFEPPHSRPIVLFFRGLGIFLVLAGIAFFLVMRHPPTMHP